VGGGNQFVLAVDDAAVVPAAVDETDGERLLDGNRRTARDVRERSEDAEANDGRDTSKSCAHAPHINGFGAPGQNTLSSIRLSASSFLMVRARYASRSAPRSRRTRVRELPSAGASRGRSSLPRAAIVSHSLASRPSELLCSSITSFRAWMTSV